MWRAPAYFLASEAEEERLFSGAGNNVKPAPRVRLPYTRIVVPPAVAGTADQFQHSLGCRQEQACHTLGEVP